MANFVELSGGTIIPSSALDGGVLDQNAALDGGAIQIAGGGGGGANLTTKSVSYTPTESAISDSLTPPGGYDGFSQVDVSVGAISSTYVGTGITRRTSSDMSASGATVTAPSGYYENSASKAIANASTPYVSWASINNDGTVSYDIDVNSAGYIADDTFSGTTGNPQISVQGAQTIYPSTSDQTIASGKYLTGTQTIKGDANLLAANIKSGVTIFGITGTYDGGGWVEQTISDSGAVTQALDPYTLYHFTGTLTSLTVTLNAPSSGEIAHYHFDFGSGSTAPTLNVPVTVTMPDDFSAPEANNRYEVDILNNYGTVVAWTAS